MDIDYQSNHSCSNIRWVGIHICIDIYMYIYIYIYTYIYVYGNNILIYICIYIYTYIYIYIYACINQHIFACMDSDYQSNYSCSNIRWVGIQICIWKFTWEMSVLECTIDLMWICLCPYIYIYIYVCSYMYTYLQL
jgi:hypothetical protein